VVVFVVGILVAGVKIGAVDAVELYELLRLGFAVDGAIEGARDVLVLGVEVGG